MACEFESRGMQTDLAPIYAQMLVGMVALTGQWWLEERKPPREQVAAHLVNLGWNGLAHLNPAHRHAGALTALRLHGRSCSRTRSCSGQQGGNISALVQPAPAGCVINCRDAIKVSTEDNPLFTRATPAMR